VEVVREKAETLAMEGNASPRKPMVRTDSMSLAVRILLVAWLETLSLVSSSDMPEPLSLTRMRSRPPSAISTSTTCGTGVKGVLRELLDHGGGAVYDLSGGHLLCYWGSSTATLLKTSDLRKSIIELILLA
jgi:hypothetical protein